MRILLVADAYPPAAGGVAAHVQRLARSLQHSGHSVCVVAAGARDEAFDDAGVAVAIVRLSLAAVPGVFVDPEAAFVPPWADRRLTSRVSSVAEGFCAEVIHAHGWCEAAADHAADSLAVPLFVTLHDYGNICPQMSHFRDGKECSHFAGLRCVRCPGSNQQALKRLGLAGALRWRKRFRSGQTYLAVSEEVAKRYRLAQPGVDVRVVPNFIDPTEVAPAPFPDRPVILYVGPREQYKGAHVFEAAYEILAASEWPGTFVHVGGSPPAYEARDYRSLGRLPPEEVAVIHRRASIFVAPAIYPDPCPTVVLEAMAAGRPVIASRIGGHLDLVTSETGILVDPGDAGQLAAAIVDLIADPLRMQRYGAAGLLRTELFSSAAVVPTIEALYARSQ